MRRPRTDEHLDRGGTRHIARVAASVTTALLLAGLAAACLPLETGPAPPAAEPGAAPEGERARVRTVVDGDSIILDGDRDVRLIAVNAPERGEGGHAEARDRLRELVGGREVTLVRDVEVRDQYGRELAYLFLDDGRFVNLLLVEEGWAQSFTVPPNVTYAERFRAAERAAREQGAGLWRPSPLTLRITELQWDAPGRDEANPAGEHVTIENWGEAPVDLRGVTVDDEANNRYRFEDGELAPGARLRLRSGRGDDRPGERYWGIPRAVWNNGGDAAVLRDAEGLFIDHWRYEGR